MSGMRVFVLSTGRCGSTTFARACQSAIGNYTAAHESRSGIADETRLDYPDQHIEVDNRLTFFLGGLAARYPSRVFYVHLKRDEAAVARSFLARWPKRGPAALRPSLRRRLANPAGWSTNLIGGYASGVILGGPNWASEAERFATCQLYVRSTTENIAEFLTDKPHMTIDIETAGESFGEFCDRIGAECDLATAVYELLLRYNAWSSSRATPSAGGSWRALRE